MAKMTLEEKLGQLQQLDGEGNGTFRPEHPDLIRKGLLGSTLNVRGAKNTNQLQHVAMDESRLKIPVLFGFDVIHGYRTIFPIPLAEASSWDPALAEQSTSIAARETYSTGLRWTFAPMLDARAFAGFREAIMARRTRSWLAPNIGSPTERRKEGVTTILLRCPKTLCERFTFRHSKPQSMPASAP